MGFGGAVQSHGGRVLPGVAVASVGARGMPIFAAAVLRDPPVPLAFFAATGEVVRRVVGQTGDGLVVAVGLTGGASSATNPLYGVTM